VSDQIKVGFEDIFLKLFKHDYFVLKVYACRHDQMVSSRQG